MAIRASGARHRDAAHGQQIGGGKVQADTEHQQDDAHLRQLAGKGRVRYEARCKRSHENAGHEIADERRQPEPVGYISEHRRKDEAYGNCRDKGCFLMHVRP